MKCAANVFFPIDLFVLDVPKVNTIRVSVDTRPNRPSHLKQTHDVGAHFASMLRCELRLFIKQIAAHGKDYPPAGHPELAVRPLCFAIEMWADPTIN